MKTGTFSSPARQRHRGGHCPPAGGRGRAADAGRRRAEPLEALAAELGLDRTLAVSGVDVTDAAAIARGFETARAKFGPVSILVNNAGEAPSAPFEKTGLDLWEKVIGVDLTGVFNVTKAALADLKAFGHGARIVNIARRLG